MSDWLDAALAFTAKGIEGVTLSGAKHLAVTGRAPLQLPRLPSFLMAICIFDRLVTK